MKPQRFIQVLGLVALVFGLWSCADRSPGPVPAERFGDEEERHDDVQAGKPVDGDGDAGDAQASDGSQVAKKVDVHLAEGSNPKLVTGKKHLDAEQFEDLLALFEPAEANRLAETDRAQLATIYHAAAADLRNKRKDLSFSSMFCERGLLLAPDHQGLLRLQVKNYLHPDMNLIGGAEEMVEKLVKIDGDDLENQLLRGKVAFEQADWDTAVFWLKKAARVGRTQRGPIIEEAWKLLDMAKGHQDEMKSALSMTRELEIRMKRARIVAQSKAVKDAPGESAEAGSDGGPADLTGGRVVLYMTRWCKFCRKTADLLTSLNVKFEQKDIERDQAALMEMMKLAQESNVEVNGVPVVQIGSKLVVGYNAELITSLINKIR